MSYIPHTDAERAAMLERIGVQSLDDLFEPIPDAVRLRRDLDIPAGLDEFSVTAHMRELATRNANMDTHVCFLGAGIYDHFAPSVVDAIASRGEFLTAYTPYQPELSQGTLQAIYEYQSLVCALTGMELSNASMYDAATAIAEGALMAIDVTNRRKVVVSRAIHPHYLHVLRTYIHTAGYELVEAPTANGVTDLDSLASVLDDTVAGVVFQHPTFFGCLEDSAPLYAAIQKVGALSVVAVDPISLGMLTPPGEYGADIVVGEGQSLGCAPAFGGPLLGFFACKQAYQRRFPGRIVGVTTDHEGRRGYTMTLRTREQDIRRDRATSNICTNEALMALCATIYLCEVGKQGLADIANLCLQKSHYAQKQVTAVQGVSACYSRPFFKEFAVRLPEGVVPREVNLKLLEDGIIGGYDLGRSFADLHGAMLFCVTETRTRAEIDRLAERLGVILG